jgi:hypothetical protein
MLFAECLDFLNPGKMKWPLRQNQEQFGGLIRDISLLLYLV